jgi:hypothetical protein
MNAPIMPHRGVLVNCGNSLLERNLAAAYLVPGAALITLSVMTSTGNSRELGGPELIV